MRLGALGNRFLVVTGPYRASIDMARCARQGQLDDLPQSLTPASRRYGDLFVIRYHFPRSPAGLRLLPGATYYVYKTNGRHRLTD